MSIPSIPINLTGGLVAEALWRKRNRLRRAVLVAGVVLTLAAGPGLSGWYKEQSLPQRDYYQWLLSELAQQHYRLTGTTTVVKENDQVVNYLQRLYHRKAQRDHKLDAPISVGREELRNFSLTPQVVGLYTYPLSFLAEQQTAPAIKFTVPAGEPLALWLFSRSEQALAVIFFEQPVIDDLAEPGLRLVELVTKANATAIAGDFKPGQMVLAHAYLLPLDRLDLGSTRWWQPDVNRFEQVVGAVPLLLGVAAAPASPGMRLDSQAVFDRMWLVVPPAFYAWAWLLRWFILPPALLWSAWLLMRTRKLRREWNGLLSQITHNPVAPATGLFRFLFADLRAQAKSLMAQEAAQRQEAALRQQEQARRKHFETEIRQSLNTLAQLGKETPCQENWLDGASTAELEAMAARCHQTVQQHQEQSERAQQTAREQMRQIHRLESEFTGLPPEDRAGIAEAWALYEQACATSDPRKRLEMLKSARKLLPKEFRVGSTD